MSNDEDLKKKIYTLHYEDRVEDSRTNKMEEREWETWHSEGILNSTGTEDR